MLLALLCLSLLLVPLHSANLRLYPQICFHALNRCPGKLTNEFRHISLSNSTILRTISARNEEECKHHFRNEPAAVGVRFENMASCVLYKYIAHDPSVPKVIMGEWKCCDLNKCTEKAGRCPGFWTLSYGMQLNDTYNSLGLPLENIASSLECQTACLGEPMCHSVNHRYEEKLCQLMMYSEREESVPSLQDILSRWTCCQGEVLRDHHNCEDVQRECHGRWAVKGENAVSEEAATVGFFYTLDVDVCLKACEDMYHCIVAHFNVSQGRCVLKGDPHRKSIDQQIFIRDPEVERSLVGFSGTAFECKCSNFVKGQGQPSALSIGWSCVRPKTSTFTIAKEHCSEIDFSMTVERQNVHDAAFWLLGNHPKTYENWTRVHNGETHVWIDLPPQRLALEPNTTACEIYSTRPDPNCPHIILPHEWHARPQAGEVSVFKEKLPVFVSILHTHAPRFRCFTKEVCEDYMRQLQKLHLEKGWSDLGYNYVIGDDGRVYQGRGEGKVGAHTKTYNYISYGIAFLGDFNTSIPTIKALKTGKQLIKCLERKGLLDPHYSIVAHRDTQVGSGVPGMALYHLMKNWDRYNFEGYNADCPYPDSRKTLMICGFVALSICLLVGSIFFIRYMGKRHAYWCPSLLPTDSSAAQLLMGVGSECEPLVSGLLDVCGLPCEVRQPSSVNVDCDKTRLHLLNTSQCRCLSRSHLMWLHCALKQRYDFPRLLNIDKVGMRSCTFSTLLLLVPETQSSGCIYLIHCPEIDELRTVAREVLGRRCICRWPTVLHQHFPSNPKTPKIKPGNFYGPENFDDTRVDLTMYERYFEVRGPHRVEISREKWMKEQDLSRLEESSARDGDTIEINFESATYHEGVSVCGISIDDDSTEM